MRGFFIHAVVFAVINALVVAAWLVTTGSTDVLSSASHDPLQAWRDGMWPLAVIAVWGGGLIIHGAVMLTVLPGRVNRQVARHVRAVQRAKHSGHRPQHEVPITPVPPPVPPVSPTAGAELGQHMAKAAMGLVENLAGKAAGRGQPAPFGRLLVTAMFTDLVSSTDLAEQLGDVTWHSMLADHRTLVRGCVGRHEGIEVGTQGDGFLVRFTTPDAGVACAIDIQRAMANTRSAGAFTPEVRIGVHAGEAMADDNDLVGRVINLASRVTGAAGPSEILVTEPVADHLAPGIVLGDRGLVSLKGIAQPRHLLQVDWRPAEHVDRIEVADTTAPEDAD
jgi:class 3 adenylate cyclase